MHIDKFYFELYLNYICVYIYINNVKIIVHMHDIKAGWKDGPVGVWLP
jgi:hypothetical protein